MATVLCLTLSAGAEASSRLCRDLESQLALASGGSSGPARKYDDAIRTQEQQLSKARARARATGCGSFVSGTRARGDCAGLNSTITKMERNLLTLQRTRATMPGGNVSRERARILASLNVNGCRDRRAAGETARATPRSVEQRGGQSGLFDRLFGGETGQRASGGEETGNKVRRVLNDGSFPDPARARGNLRTMCVRTCDGYFFPISNQSGVGDLTRDQQICEARCPGTEVRLYHHRFPSEDTDQMVSAANGEPYSALPSAFLYRKADFNRPQACGCNAPRNFTVVAGELPAAEADTAAATATPLPVSRPDPADDPETLANRDGGLDLAALRRLAPRASPTASIDAEPAERQVRVVGPVFLPDPEGAIDLRAPALRTVP